MAQTLRGKLYFLGQFMGVDGADVWLHNWFEPYDGKQVEITVREIEEETPSA